MGNLPGCVNIFTCGRRNIYLETVVQESQPWFTHTDNH